ncbi:mitochondrial membrane protein, variant 2 [Taiwanofungus camphoratus]|nr:mitochondrial membrane protein, variant 2 [Antrodia cinnamomea]
MPTELPYAADAEVSLSYDELEVLRLQYQKELAQSHVTVQSKFNYAWGLVKSPMRDHQVEGVRLLQEIYRAEPTRRRECLYYLALGHYKMGNYEEAKKFNSLLMEKEPTNMQAQSLATLIDQRVTRGSSLPSVLPLLIPCFFAMSTLIFAFYSPSLLTRLEHQFIQRVTLAWPWLVELRRSARFLSRPLYGEQPANSSFRPF